MAEAKNQCAGDFGGIYDFYISRPRLSCAIGHIVWGVELAPMYEQIESLAVEGGGAQILDLPCGSGLSLRGLKPGQDVRFIAADIDQTMLDRTRKKAEALGLTQVETRRMDMRAIELNDASVDVACSYSGLHMINEAEAAVHELGRVVKPGGRLFGSSFTADGTRRKRFLVDMEVRRQGIARPPADAPTIEGWLNEAGFEQISMGGVGFAIFSAVRAG